MIFRNAIFIFFFLFLGPLAVSQTVTDCPAVLEQGVSNKPLSKTESDQLILRSLPYIRSIALSLTKSPVHSHFDDLVAFGNLLVVEMVRGGEITPRTAGSFIRNRLRWRMVDYLRLTNRYLPLSVSNSCDGEAAEVEIVDERANPEADAIGEQASRRLNCELGRLPPKQKEMVLMILNEGLKPVQVAKRLNTGKPAVSMALKKASAQLNSVIN